MPLTFLDRIYIFISLQGLRTVGKNVAYGCFQRIVGLYPTHRARLPPAMRHPMSDLYASLERAVVTEFASVKARHYCQ